MAHSDLLVSHWPNAVYLRRAIQEWGQLPLWNSAILSGAPFAADPLSGMFYPPNWLAVLLPVSLGFNLLFWLHLAFAGLGMWKFLRAKGVGMAGALLGGLAFSGCPKLIGHIGLGHVGLVSAVCWTPWVLLGVHRLVDELAGGARRWIREAALAGCLLGVVFLADPRWSLPCALLALAYGLRRVAHSRSEGGARWLQALGAGATAGAFSLALAAVLALPLWELTRLSMRAALSGAEQAALSLPAARLAGIWLPDLGGYAEWLTSPGVAVLFLAILAAVGAAPGWVFWGSVAVVGLILSLGDQTPLYPLLARLVPGVGLLRIPSRMLFICNFALAALAGLGADRLLEGEIAPKAIRRLRLGLAAALAFALLVAAAAAFLAQPPGADLRPAALGLAALAILAFAWAVVGLRWRQLGWRLAAAWGLLLLIDLGWIGGTLIQARSLERSLDQGRQAVEWILDQEDDEQRVFSPSYSIPQHTAAAGGLELADGVNPLQLTGYRDFMAMATGFIPSGYSVTLPPYPSGDPSQDWGADLDGEHLGLLNVVWVVSAYPLESPMLIEESTIEGQYLYRNAAARPRAWIEPDSGEAEAPWLAVEALGWTPNRIAIRAAGPGLLVLSEIDYPGWRVEVDGEPAELQTVHEVLRAVDLPAGEHQVVFSFCPWTLFTGAAFSLLALAALIYLRLRR
jgi:hypothetical protein